MQFLFPSTGTAFPNGCLCAGSQGFVCVSIPFNRDGVSEQADGELDEPESCQEISIPFNRDGVSEHAIKNALKGKTHKDVFLFPSTGTAFLNFVNVDDGQWVR